jgi:hypothetical protein
MDFDLAVAERHVYLSIDETTLSSVVTTRGISAS